MKLAVCITGMIHKKRTGPVAGDRGGPVDKVIVACPACSQTVPSHRKKDGTVIIAPHGAFTPDLPEDPELCSGTNERIGPEEAGLAT